MNRDFLSPRFENKALHLNYIAYIPRLFETLVSFLADVVDADVALNSAELVLNGHKARLAHDSARYNSAADIDLFIFKFVVVIFDFCAFGCLCGNGNLKRIVALLLHCNQLFKANLSLLVDIDFFLQNFIVLNDFFRHNIIPFIKGAKNTFPHPSVDYLIISTILN